MRCHFGNVAILLVLTADTLGEDGADEVVVVTAVPVEDEVDAVVEESEVYTDVELVLLLVGELAVGDRLKLDTEFLYGAARAPGVVGVEDGGGIGYIVGA